MAPAPCLLAVLLQALPAGAAEPLPLERFEVRRPGVVLVVPAARRQQLDRVAAPTRAAWCGRPPEHELVSHEAVTRIRVPDGDEDRQTDTRSHPFGWTIMVAAAAVLGFDDAAARRTLIANLRRWARGEALTKLEPHDNAYYALERTLLPTIVSYALVRDHPDLAPEEQELIERWLNRLVRLRGIKRPPDSRSEATRLNNHRFLSGSVDMAWGVLRGEDDLFRRGIGAFRLALEQLRDDGSLPLEVERGARALYYQRHAIASLVTMAEMAALQDYDLYGETVNGRGLHDAIGFLDRAIREPTLVWTYARANRNPGPFENYKVQDLTFMARRGHGRHYMAWLEAYRARFPDRPAAHSLWRRLAEFEPEPRPMIDEYSGGNATCLFAAPD